MSSRSFVTFICHIAVKVTGHTLKLSSEKINAALAIYLRKQGRGNGMERFNCDAEAKFRGAYKDLDCLEDCFGWPIEILSNRGGFDFVRDPKRPNRFLAALHAR